VEARVRRDGRAELGKSRRQRREHARAILRRQGNPADVAEASDEVRRRGVDDAREAAARQHERAVRPVELAGQMEGLSRAALRSALPHEAQLDRRRAAPIDGDGNQTRRLVGEQDFSSRGDPEARRVRLRNLVRPRGERRTGDLLEDPRQRAHGRPQALRVVIRGGVGDEGVEERRFPRTEELGLAGQPHAEL
jgi:hypothetical protein